MTDPDLIDSLGGDTILAKKLGFGPYGAQRVHNWRTRGIPAAVKLQWPDLFLPGWQAPKRRKKP